MDPGQRLGELGGELPAGALELGLPKNTRRDGGSIDEAQQHSRGSEPASGGLERHGLGHRDVRPCCSLDQIEFLAKRNQ